MRNELELAKICAADSCTSVQVMNASMEMLGVIGAASSMPSMATSSQVGEEGSKKIRKPYTITKSRESWTEQEHDKFLEALQLFDRDWKKIEAFVGSKTVIQIRSHAQKYFLKVQKNGTGEHVPPPRPKRKSAQPYPQKAPKSAPVQPLVSRSLPSSTAQADSAYALGQQRRAAFASSGTGSPTVSTWVHQPVPAPGTVAYVSKDGSPVSMVIGRNPSSCSSGSSSGGWTQQVLPAGKVSQACLLAAPDFAEVYKFIGNVFDPGVTGHLKRLKEMAPIDRETVLLLMRNLSINLSSPDFEEHKLFLSVYDIPVEARPTAEDQINVQSVAPPAPSASDVGDDNASMSGQPASAKVGEGVESENHLEPNQDPQLVKPVYSESAGDVSQQQRHIYNDGGGGVSPIGVPAAYAGISSSPRVLEASPLALQQTVGLQSQRQAVSVASRRTEVYGLGMPPLVPRASDAGSVDAWWS